MFLFLPLERPVTKIRSILIWRSPGRSHRSLSVIKNPTGLSGNFRPRAVSEYADTGDFDFVVSAQKTLNSVYIADMAKYDTAQEMTKIIAAWASVPAQLAKENHKFQYKVIKSGARAYEFETPLDWLKTAGIVNKCIRVSEGKMPLSAYADNDSFKDLRIT